jgi:hypothetical protein
MGSKLVGTGVYVLDLINEPLKSSFREVWRLGFPGLRFLDLPEGILLQVSPTHCFSKGACRCAVILVCRPRRRLFHLDLQEAFDLPDADGSDRLIANDPDDMAERVSDHFLRLGGKAALM